MIIKTKFIAVIAGNEIEEQVLIHVPDTSGPKREYSIYKEAFSDWLISKINHLSWETLDGDEKVDLTKLINVEFANE